VALAVADDERAELAITTLIGALYLLLLQDRLARQSRRSPTPSLLRRGAAFTLPADHNRHESRFRTTGSHSCLSGSHFCLRLPARDSPDPRADNCHCLLDVFNLGQGSAARNQRFCPRSTSRITSPTTDGRSWRKEATSALTPRMSASTLSKRLSTLSNRRLVCC